MGSYGVAGQAVQERTSTKAHWYAASVTVTAGPVIYMYPDQVLLEVFREQGSPAVILLDLRPLEYPMLVVCNADVAEQVTKASSRWYSSTPKSPTLKAIWHLTGKESILTDEVASAVPIFLNKRTN